MLGIARSLRALGATLFFLATCAGCQAVLGDYKIDDGAFQNGGGSGGSGGDGNSGGSGGSGGPDSGVVQTGPIRVMPIDGLYTTEWGGQTTFSVVLESQPTADVTVALSSDKPTEGSVTPQSLTFTKDDWNAPQVVTVTGVDDAVPDHNQTYHIVTAPATSSDPLFNGVDAVDVTVINIDNETAGITVNPTTDLVTSESGARDTFTVVLNSAPVHDVTINLSSSKPTEGTVSPDTLVFTSANWMAPQLVTVTGVDDAAKDGPQPYTIITAPATSTDPTYNGVDAADVQVVNQDNETAGFTVTLVTGIDPTDKTKLRTSESGDMATFTVVLNAPPSGDVTIPISSSAVDEGAVSPTTLKFTALNFMAPQTVTVSGVDDSVADGNQPYNVVLGKATSADADYNDLQPDAVSVTNVDNDKPGFNVVLVSGIDPNDTTKLVTSEQGAAATFTIALTSKPSAPVTVNLSSSIPTEGKVAPITLSFSTANWNAPQTVTVTGIDDKVADGNQPYFVRTGAATSMDPGYQALDPPDIQLTNIDNDSAGVILALRTGIDPLNSGQLITSERGDTATFTVALTSQPTADVTIPLTSSNTKEGTVSPAALTFTAANYAAPQTVTVTGVDDKVVDGNQPYEIQLAAATSKDTNYSGHFPNHVALTNRDDDTAAIIVQPTTGLTTSEAGVSASFTIQLQSQPTADVTIALSSSNTAEGKVGVASVKFTSVNWNAPQTIMVTGQQDDGTADGNQTYRITTAAAVSTDKNYSGLDPADVTLTNLDDDTAGIIVPVTMGLTTKEAGGTATFTIVLQSKPTASVKIGLTSSRTTEGTVNPASVTFTTANWGAPQSITVTGVNDSVQDGNQLYTIITGAASSTDPNYNGRDAPDVSVTNIDDDSASVLVVPPTTATTNEKGGTATFTVVLNSQPTASVTIGVSSNNTAEGTVAPTTLTFTTANWNAPQIVTATGVDDKVADGNQPYKVLVANAASTDVNYNGKFATQVSLTNIDDDSAGVVVTPPLNPTTTEIGGTATFTVVLTSQPTAGVTVAVSSNDTTEGTVAPASLSFTTLNWSAPQTVTVTGVDDAVQDGNQPYLIVIANAVSTDGNYSGKFGAQVALTNTDNDTAGVTVTAAPALLTGEDGTTATFTVRLNSQPTAAVSITVTSSKTSEGTVSPSALSFSTANWKTAQTVTVTGVDDQVADGNQPYSVLLANAVSGDTNYSGKFATQVSLVNVDNDQPGVQVTAAPNLQTTEKGGTATFTVQLSSQPIANVTIGVSSSKTSEGTVDAPSLLFTAGNWQIPQTVTVTGVDDQVADGTQPYTVRLAAATSADPGYSGKFASVVNLTNADDDSLGILVTPTTCATTPTTTATFTIVLTSQPLDDVTIALSSDMTNEGTVSPDSVTFTATTWNIAQTVTVTGVDDMSGIPGLVVPFTIITGAAQSVGDMAYNGHIVSDVSCTNTMP